MLSVLVIAVVLGLASGKIQQETFLQQIPSAPIAGSIEGRNDHIDIITNYVVQFIGPIICADS